MTSKTRRNMLTVVGGVTGGRGGGGFRGGRGGDRGGRGGGRGRGDFKPKMRIDAGASTGSKVTFD